jgi:hypothetical protein
MLVGDIVNRDVLSNFNHPGIDLTVYVRASVSTNPGSEP